MKKNTVLLIGGVAALGGLLWYFSKNKSEGLVQNLLPEPELTPANQKLKQLPSIDILVKTSENTGVARPSLPVQELLAQFQPSVLQQTTVEPDALPIRATSSVLRTPIAAPAVVRAGGPILRTAGLRGPWRVNQ